MHPFVHRIFLAMEGLLYVVKIIQFTPFSIKSLTRSNSLNIHDWQPVSLIRSIKVGVFKFLINKDRLSFCNFFIVWKFLPLCIGINFHIFLTSHTSLYYPCRCLYCIDYCRIKTPAIMTIMMDMIILAILTFLHNVFTLKEYQHHIIIFFQALYHYPVFPLFIG